MLEKLGPYEVLCWGKTSFEELRPEYLREASPTEAWRKSTLDGRAARMMSVRYEHTWHAEKTGKRPQLLEYGEDETVYNEIGGAGRGQAMEAN